MDPVRQLPPVGGGGRVCRLSLNRCDCVSLLVSLVDAAVRFDDLFKRVATVYGRTQRSLLDRAFEEDEVVGLFARVISGDDRLAAGRGCPPHGKGAYRRGGVQNDVAGFAFGGEVFYCVVDHGVGAKGSHQFEIRAADRIPP